MKNIILTLLIIVFPFQLMAQKLADKFTLSPAGFEDSVVREYPGKKDAQLFLAAKYWADYTLSNSEEAVTRSIEDQYLEYRVFIPQAFSITDEGITYTWDALFDFSLRFEDERIRYDIEIVEISSPDAPSFQIVGGLKDWAFYATGNEPYPLTSEARKILEDKVNDFIRGVSSYVNRDAEMPEKG